MAHKKLSVSDVLDLLDQNDEDIFDDIHEPCQDGSDEEFHDSDADFDAVDSDDYCVGTDGSSGDEEMVGGSDEDNADVSKNYEDLQDIQTGTL